MRDKESVISLLSREEVNEHVTAGSFSKHLRFQVLIQLARNARNILKGENGVEAQVKVQGIPKTKYLQTSVDEVVMSA